MIAVLKHPQRRFLGLLHQQRRALNRRVEGGDDLDEYQRGDHADGAAAGLSADPNGTPWSPWGSS